MPELNTCIYQIVLVQALMQIQEQSSLHPPIQLIHTTLSITYHLLPW